jgi:hypothetical protein
MVSKAPWTKRQQIPNLQVKEPADAFEAASRLLYKDMMRPDGETMLPFLNVSIMAVELYLKSLSSSSVFVPTAWDPDMEAVHASPDAPTHNLKRVFNAIPADVQQKIEDAFKKWPSYEGKPFVDRLAPYEKLFMASRYSFDPNLSVDGILIDRLVDVVKFLKQFVGELEPAELITWPTPATTT